uniref:HhH-GPD domain-containing protein n=1 Tax=Globisporangium ultimum (strain ATCC 200006 / CBS 805.95 / DAOM BR144) TaxID=431595 RepID=K3WE80_GLOUD
MRAREKMTAPIDQFGTHACVAPHAQSDANKRFHILVAALLSSQTNDKITHAAMQRLHEQLRSPNDNEDNEDGNEGLTVAKVRATSETQLDALLTPVGFHRRKAQQLKQIADTLHAQYKDDIPRTYTRLTALPGIGPKIARVILLVAWSEAADGVIVDTHVHRLAGRLGWARTKGSSERTAEATRVALEEWVPREYWTPFSRAVVGFGQT